jgi:hypothetical protein
VKARKGGGRKRGTGKRQMGNGRRETGSRTKRSVENETKIGRVESKVSVGWNG